MSILKHVLFVTMFSCAVYAQEEATVVIPDFSGPDLPKEFKFNNSHWKCEKGILRSPDHSKGGLSGFYFLKKDLTDYEIQFRVRKIAQHPKDQHFGFSPRKGVSIYCRGNILVRNVPEQNVHTGFGKIFKRNLPVGKNAEWNDFIITVKGPEVTVKLNNELIASAKDFPERTEKLSFYTYGNQLEISDFSLKIFQTENNAAKAEVKSPNSVINASFERCTLDNLPDYWGVPAWGMVEPDVIVNYYSEWINRYTSDGTTAVHGKRSLRIMNTEAGKAKLSYTLWSCFLNEKKNVPYTLTAYLKSDTPGMKLMMRAFGVRRGSKNETMLSLTTEWKRYTLTFTPRDTGVGPLMFIPYSRGTFWIDAVQVEPGTQATPFQEASMDRRLTTHEGNPDKPLYNVPVHKTQFFQTPPKADGVLDDLVWKKVKPVFLNTPSGKAPQEKTSAGIFYTAQGIWIGIDVNEAESDRIACRKSKRDEYVWNDPSIELFIDSKLTRAVYHHLSFNADGVQYDDYLGNAVWNGKWKVWTARKKDHSGWTAEVFLPFSDMNIDHANTDRWGFNLCRNNTRKGEISCWAPTYGGFHAPLRFGQLSIRPDIQKKYLAGIKAPVLRYAGTGKNEFSAIIYNNTGKTIFADVNARISPEKGGSALSFRKQVELPDKQERKIVFGIVPGKLTDRFSVETVLSGDNQEISSSSCHVSSGNLLSALTRFNYCTTEKTMSLRGRVNINSALLNRAGLKVDILNEKGETVYRADVLIRNGKFETQLPVGKWKNGRYKALCRLVENGKSIASAESIFRKLAPSRTEVKIDRFRRITLVNGKPFFPLGFFWEGRLTPELIEFLAKGGVNFVHSYMPIPENVLKAGRKHGVMFEMEILGQRKSGINRALMERFKKEPAMLCWYTYDEAFAGFAQKNPEKIFKDIDAAREIDPYRPVVLLENQYGMSFLDQKGMDFPGDIPTVDYYAWPPSGNVQLWNNYSKTLVRMGEADGRPAFAVPFVSGYGYHTSRDILPQEQEYQTYICVINGCRAIAYWASFPKAPSSFRTISRLFTEIRTLMEPLLSLEDVPELSAASPDIRFTLKKHNGAYYLITVNESRSPVRTRFDLSKLASVRSAEVLFENRTLPANHILEDTWKGFQRHVYKLK